LNLTMIISHCSIVDIFIIIIIITGYQGKKLPVSEASMISGEETAAAILLSMKKKIKCP